MTGKARELLDAAVRAALKDFHDEPKLKANLLLASCLVKCMAGGHSAKPTPKKSIASLKNMLRDTVAELAGHPRRGKQARLLEHTYLEPLGSQEEVAEHMSMSMSTFRRHLKAAVASVSAAIGTRIEECRVNCSSQMSGQGAPEHVQIQCEPEQPTIDRRGQSDRRKRSFWRPPALGHEQGLLSVHQLSRRQSKKTCYLMIALRDWRPLDHEADEIWTELRLVLAPLWSCENAA